MKYVVVIGDGMADNPLPALGGKTPLEAAHTPAMDALAKGGRVGSVRTVPPGTDAGSDTAILDIFGYDPRRYHSGRSPLEAAGAGIRLQPGDVSYRCNMICLSDDAPGYPQKKIVSHNGGAIDEAAALALAGALLADRRFAALAQSQGLVLHPSPSFRHIAVQKGADVAGLRALPPHDHLGETVAACLPHGAPVAGGLRQLMELAHAVLNSHPINQGRRAAGRLPANGIWFWAEGTAMPLPSFYETYGAKGAVISAVPLVRGIGALAGMATPEVEGATGELDTNYEGKADAALAALAGGCDFAAVHVEAPDECTHGGDLAGKVEAIQRLDGRCVARLKAGLDAVGEPYRLLVLSDHKTLMENGRHDGGPVPYILYDSRQAQGCGLPYSEKSCEGAALLEEGCRLISVLLEKLP